MSLADPLWEEIRIAGHLAGRPVHFFECTRSTNLAAMEMGRAGADHGTVVLADAQTGGRGRLGKSWLSPPGTGLYFSTILRPRLALRDLPKITLAAGLAVCRAVETETGLAPAIKWPNDLLLAGRKFCGILTESGPLLDGGAPLVVLGIGLNVATAPADFPEPLRAKATSLLAHAATLYGRGRLLAAILGQLDAALQRLERGEFPAILSEWRERDALAGRHLSWVTPAGKIVAGVALGPDPDGAFRIRDEEGGVHEVLSGDLSLAGRTPMEPE